MEETKTAYGTLRIGSEVAIFREIIEILEVSAATYGDPFTVGLTGGSTPKAFYKWAVDNNRL